MDAYQVLPPAASRVPAASTGQYSATRIIGLWVLAAVPMAVLAWVIAPVLVANLRQPPALSFWLALFAGTVWQSVVALWFIRHEEGNLRWSTIRRRVWLTQPRVTRTGAPRTRAFLWVLPCSLASLLLLGIGVLIANPLFFRVIFERLRNVPYFPRFAVPAYVQVTELASSEFAGQWWLVGLAILGALLACFLGEELSFRGLLLPRMAGACGPWDWAANGVLYGLYNLHKPWMIPFRVVDGLAIAWPARRYRSNWLAVLTHGAEGLALIGLVLIGVTSSGQPTSPVPLDLPFVQREPAPSAVRGGVLPAVPAYDPSSPAAWQVDLRNADLSALDLRGEMDNLLHADFDSHTVWPAAERLPEGFDPGLMLAQGKNPGLGLRGLHAQGTTGRSVGVAIIDQPLLADHAEYADRLRWYEKINVNPIYGQASMHGAAVTSLAVGRTVGVAPEADLYYVATDSDVVTTFVSDYHNLARAVRRVLQINEGLPAERKMRVISM